MSEVEATARGSSFELASEEGQVRGFLSRRNASFPRCALLVRRDEEHGGHCPTPPWFLLVLSRVTPPLASPLQNLHSTVFTGLYAGHLSPTPRPVTASATADAAARAATTPAAPAPAPAITSLLAAQGLLYTAAEDRTIRIWRA